MKPNETTDNKIKEITFIDGPYEGLTPYTVYVSTKDGCIRLSKELLRMEQANDPKYNKLIHIIIAICQTNKLYPYIFQ